MRNGSTQGSGTEAIHICKDIIGLVDAAAVIREVRTRAGLTQAQLAHQAGTSQPTLAAYESGAKSPSVRTLDRIARAAGSSLDVIVWPAPAARGQLLDELRRSAQEIRTAARQRRIRNVRVFGSVARGEETANSDVDLLVDFNAARYGVLPLAAFAHEVSAIIRRDVDATTVGLLRADVRERALVEAVPL
jgi:predicted nucleotidyltransferase/DNA-binding XRE family transcriptional regulator